MLPVSDSLRLRVHELTRRLLTHAWRAPEDTRRDNQHWPWNVAAQLAIFSKQAAIVLAAAKVAMTIRQRRNQIWPSQMVPRR